MRQTLLMVVCAGFLGTASLAVGQTPVPPVAVPAGPAMPSDDPHLSLRHGLEQRHTALLDRFKKWKGRADAFNQKYGGHEFDADSQDARDGAAEQAWLAQESQDYMRVADAFATDVNKFTELVSDPCLPLQEQLERDRHALEVQQKSIGATLDQLDEWTRANDEAQKKALQDAVKALLAGLGDKLAQRLNAARAYQGWLTRYQKQMVEMGVPYEALEMKIDRAASGYGYAMVAATGGVALKEGVKAADLWELVKAEIGSIANSFSESDTAIREVIADHELKKIMNTDGHAYLDLTSSFLEMASDSKELAPIFTKIVGAGTLPLVFFIRDYGYDATQWGLSRERILQQGHLSERNLDAVKALRRQIESTMKKREDCKTRAVPNQ